MKTQTERSGLARTHAGPVRVRAGRSLFALALAVAFLLAVAACVTPIPRALQTEAPAPTPAVSPLPTPAEPSLNEPTPSAAPTATATPVPTRTAVPRPTSAPRLETPVPSPEPTDLSGELTLQVFAPEDGATVPGSAVIVYGQTSPGLRVFISGIETEVDAEGGFRADVSLAPSDNVVTITAISDTGQERTVSRTVTSLALPFLLLVTEPENESIVSFASLPLSGRTGPNAIVSINGRSVSVDRFGYFSSSVQLEEGPNVIDVVATNDDGRTLSSVLAVIYRAPGG